MKLSQLLSLFAQLGWGDDPTATVEGVTSDSRQVKPGFVFVAVRGHAADGHLFLSQAVASGAIALVVEDSSQVPLDYKGAVVQVSSTREALDKIAARYFGDPAHELFCVGVTGTNGKTSVTYMIEHLLNRFGWPTGVLGTINHHLGEKIWNSELTTPDPVTLQKRIREFLSLNAKAVAFEVSSHALDQQRVDQIPFDVGVFTNLTRDHLDYHKDMETYFSAKERLFNSLLAKSKKHQVYAVINKDDPYGQRMQVGNNVKVWSYSEREGDFVFKILSQGFDGSKIQLRTPRGESEALIPLPGRHNIYNGVAAIATAMAAGMSLKAAAEAMSSFTGVPGRLQKVENNKKLNIFVDYAHTDDALKSVLSSLNHVRELSGKKNKIITVFGCGGDRDKGKRPLMAQVASELSDKVVITSDNPRTEDPMSIIQDGLNGLSQEIIKKKVSTQIDRRSAIAHALQSAQENDVILIAGKGHENYQIIGTKKIAFDDVAVVKELLQAN